MKTRWPHLISPCLIGEAFLQAPVFATHVKLIKFSLVIMFDYQAIGHTAAPWVSSNPSKATTNNDNSNTNNNNNNNNLKK